jgi:hypothetical protein
MTMNRILSAVLSAALLIGAWGCTSYYRVTDPTTGRVYYTTEMNKKGDGAVELTDARTGNKVTIQNSEVKTINKEEYETARGQSGLKP